MLYRLLGPLEVTDGDRPVRLGEGRQRSVLVLLLLHRNEAVASERLIDALWGEEPPATAAKVLQNYVGQLRRALDDREGQRLQTRGRGYALRVDGRRARRRPLRAAACARAARRSRASDPADAAARLREALGAVARAGAGRRRLRAVRAARDRAARGAARWRRSSGASTPTWRSAATPIVVAELEALVAEHPLRERLRAPADARAVSLRAPGGGARGVTARRGALLVEEVGVEPGPELRELHEAILRQDPALERRAAAELPRELDADGAPPLVGRDRELRVAARALGAGARRSRCARRAGRRAGHRQDAAGGRARGRGAPRRRRACCTRRAARPEAALAAMRRARERARPTLLVVDDADASDAARAAAGASWRRELATQAGARAGDRRRRRERSRGSAADDVARARAARRGRGARIALLYAPGDADADVPVEELLEASRGVPGRVHERRERVGAARGDAPGRRRRAARAAAGRSELRAAEAELAERRRRPAGGARARRAARAATRRRWCARSRGWRPSTSPTPRTSSVASGSSPSSSRGRVGAPLLGVVGPSGSGKSSVVRAGLLPALAGGVLPGSDEWPQVRRSGPASIRCASCAARGLGGAPAERRRAGGRPVRGGLHRLPRRARARGVHRRARRDGRATPARRRRARRAGRLLRRAAPPTRRWRSCSAPTTCSSGRCSATSCGGRSSGPRSAPASHVEPELVDALVADVEGEPGAPAAAVDRAARALAASATGAACASPTYERTGGVRGAVARLAEEAFGRLDPAQQAVARDGSCCASPARARAARSFAGASRSPSSRRDRDDLAACSRCSPTAGC